MGHNISEVRGRNEFAYNRKNGLPWHGLGQAADGLMTAEEVVRLSGLDYEVSKVPNLIRWGGDIVEAPSFSTVRVDTGAILGTVGSDYTVVQNTQAFAFFDTIVQRGEAIYETGGVLGNGEIAFLSAKLDGVIKVGKDVVENYVLLIMSHDGSSSIRAMYTPVRVVCNNTLNAALQRHKDYHAVRHTLRAEMRLAEAAATMGLVHRLTPQLEEVFNMMAKAKVTDGMARTHLQNMVLNREQLAKVARGEEHSTRAKNIIDAVERYYYEGVGQQADEARGTVWGLYNAVTGYFQNVNGYDSPETKFRANLMGGAHDRMEEALRYCIGVGKGAEVAVLN